MEIILVGGFSEMIELAHLCGHEIKGIMDLRPYTDTHIPYLGDESKAAEIYERFKSNVSIILSPDSPGIRQKLFKQYSDVGFHLGSLISPQARISPSAIIGARGITIQSGVNVSANAHICEGARLNVNANVMHDSIVGKFTTIAPNAVILGKVNIGENVYIGANATILPGLKIGNNAIVGAGAVVTKNVDAHTVVAGVPARVMKSK